MKISLRHKIRLPVGLSLMALCIWSGCTASKTARVVPEIVETDQEVLRGTQQEELMAELAVLDSLPSEERRHESVYIMALDNFVALAEHDRRVPKVILWKGNFYFDKAMYSKAIRCYRLLIKKYRKTHYFIEAMKKVARAYARNGEFENAEIWYRRLRQYGHDSLRQETRSSRAGKMYRDARIYERKRRYNKAGSIYYKISKLFPETDIAPRGLFSAGNMKQRLGKYNSAIRIYRRFLKKYYESPLVPSVLLEEANCWKKRRNVKKAAQKYLNVVKLFPRSDAAKTALKKAGQSFSESEETIIAARIFERYAELYPADKHTCSLLATAESHFKKNNILDKLEKIKFIRANQCGDKGRIK